MSRPPTNRDKSSQGSANIQESLPPSLWFFKALPKWLSVAVLLYVAVLISIGMFRGQNIKFFPPEIGGLPANGSSELQREKNDFEAQNKSLAKQAADLTTKYNELLSRDDRPILE